MAADAPLRSASSSFLMEPRRHALYATGVCGVAGGEVGSGIAAATAARRNSLLRRSPKDFLLRSSPKEFPEEVPSRKPLRR